jgi:hypothetical protein
LSLQVQQNAIVGSNSRSLLLSGLSAGAPRIFNAARQRVIHERVSCGDVARGALIYTVSAP